MHFEESASFGVVDYCIFAAILLFSVGIGIYMSFKGNKSPEDYLMGSRSLGCIPTATSLLISFLSAISLLGLTGEAYAYGIQLSVFIIGGVFGILFSLFVFLPVYYPLKLTSISEYIELRFKSSKLRSFVTFTSCLNNFIYMGICLYAPTIALATITPLSSFTYILILGGVCAFYSTIGGIRAVVWTDVFQFIVTFAGLIGVYFLGCIEVGGFRKVWSIASEGGRTNIFNMSLSIYERHTLFNTFIFGVTFYAAAFSTSQVNLQRISAVPSIKDAKKVLILNVVGMVVVYYLIYLNGLVAYAAYSECDPLLLGKIERKEEILPYFVVDRLGYIYGLPGLFVAMLVAGTLSTISSVISAIVAMVWKEACSLSKTFDNLSPKFAMLINKLLSVITGAAVIGMATIASKATSLIQFGLTVAGVIFGPIFGVFLLGLLFPKCNMAGVWSGLMLSSSFLCWISVGAYFHVNLPETLPFSTTGCNFTVFENFTQLSTVTWNILNNSHTNELNLSNVEQTTTENYFSFPLMKLYCISYTWYTCLGALICVVIGMIVSYVTGLEDASNVPQELTATFIRKYYWKEKNNEKVDHTTDKLIIQDLDSNDKEHR